MCSCLFMFAYFAKDRLETKWKTDEKKHGKSQRTGVRWKSVELPKHPGLCCRIVKSGS